MHSNTKTNYTISTSPFSNTLSTSSHMVSQFFFFQAEDGIRDRTVTGSDVCSSDLDEAFLQFDGHRGIGEAASRSDRPAVGIDEGHAGLTALDVPLEQVAEMARKRTIEVITKEVGDLPTLHLGRAAGTALTHRPPL